MQKFGPPSPPLSPEPQNKQTQRKRERESNSSTAQSRESFASRWAEYVQCMSTLASSAGETDYYSGAGLSRVKLGSYAVSRQKRCSGWDLYWRGWIQKVHWMGGDQWPDWGYQLVKTVCVSMRSAYVRVRDQDRDRDKGWQIKVRMSKRLTVQILIGWENQAVMPPNQ